MLTGNYEQAPRWFIPGYDVSHAIAAVLLRDRIGERGQILVLAAGGGVEMSVFARECPGWSFIGVDPSVEMLRQARARLDSIGASDRVSWIHGEIRNAPLGPFDATTAFLMMNFVPDDGQRLATLREIHARLKPGAPFLMIAGCSDQGSTQFEDDLRLYVAFGRRSGAPAEAVQVATKMQRENLHYVTVEREKALLAEAGFSDTRQFYSGLWVYGWISRA